MSLKVLNAHVRLRLLQILKDPGYVLSTLIFPALFFLIFALPNADTEPKARVLLGSFSVFAILGVCLFQFGVEHAQEVRSGWFSRVKTLPVPKVILFVSLAFNALICAILSALVVFLVVNASTEANFTILNWLKLVCAILLGATPFALLAASISMWVTQWSALPVFNLIYILSSFAGGLWIPPNALPSKIELASRYLPTRHLGEIAWKISLSEPVETKYIIYLAIFAVVSGVFYRLSIWRFKDLQKI